MFARAHQYIRESTLTDFEAQKNAVTAYYQNVLIDAGYTLGFLFSDTPEQRRRPFFQRPGVLEFLRTCADGEGLVVASLSNAFINHDEFVEANERLEGRDIELHVVAENDPPPTYEVARMRAELLEDLARAEAERARERAVERYAECRRQGKAIGRPPLGMKWTGPRGRRRLVPDEKDRKTMEQIRELSAKGFTLDEIFWHLLRAGVQRSSRREWARATIWQVLQISKSVGNTSN
jgi:DNA invertase Pin-like site-specific DNA recombinase